MALVLTVDDSRDGNREQVSAAGRGRLNGAALDPFRGYEPALSSHSVTVDVRRIDRIGPTGRTSG